MRRASYPTMVQCGARTPGMRYLILWNDPYRNCWSRIIRIIRCIYATKLMCSCASEIMFNQQLIPWCVYQNFLVLFILNIKLPTKSTYYSSSLIKDTLKSNLKLKKNCSRGINYLLLKLFSIDELITSSVLGVSTKKGQRKGLNEDKRSFKVISQFLKKKLFTCHLYFYIGT